MAYTVMVYMLTAYMLTAYIVMGERACVLARTHTERGWGGVGWDGMGWGGVGWGWGWGAVGGSMTYKVMAYIFTVH